MRKITVSEFREAMIIIENYCDQINGVYDKRLNEIGCRVRLSKYGRGNISKIYFNKEGTVVDWLEWYPQKNLTGLVTVKWDGVKKPQTMHIHNVELISKTQTP